MLFFPAEFTVVAACCALDHLVGRLEKTLAVQSLGAVMRGPTAALVLLGGVLMCLWVPLLLEGMRAGKGAAGGVRRWLGGVLAVGGVAAVYEMNLYRLGTCAPHVAAAFRSPSQLLLALPLQYYLSGDAHPDGYTAMAVCLALYLWQYDGNFTYTAGCGQSGAYITVSMSFAVAYLYYFAWRVRDAPCLVPAALVGTGYALTLCAAPAVALPLELLRVGRYMAFVAAVVRIRRMPNYGLAHICLAGCAGAAVLQFMESANMSICEAFSLSFICGLMMVKLITNSFDDSAAAMEYAGPKALARSPGNRQALLGAILLLFFFAYPIGRGEDGGGDGAPVRAMSLAKRMERSLQKLAEARQQEKKDREDPVTREVGDWRQPLPPQAGRRVPIPDYPDNALVNATLVYMDSKRKPLAKALKKVQRNFLDCFPYPIHVFKDDLTEAYRVETEKHTTSPITWHNVDHLFDDPPNNVTMATARMWIEVMKMGRGHHFGYRIMCRFFSGVFATFGFMKEYEFYWRLDTDSWINAPVLVDPIRMMVTNGCTYGHMGKPTFDAPEVTTDLLDTVVDWARERNVAAHNVTRLLQGVLDPRTGQRKAPMFYNNFEIASTAWLTGEDYTSYFKYLDYTDGFMKYRWGDAPVRTFAVFLMLDRAELCDFETYVPYHHGRYNNDDAMRQHGQHRQRPAVCPAQRMASDPGTGKYLWPPHYVS